jgi:hypothetical protein
MSEFTPTIIHHALHRNVLLVAVTREEGAWACYCTPVPGQSHAQEKHLWEPEGCKTSEAIARVAFPQFTDLPYAR